MKILVPCDFSDASKKAIEFAIELDQKVDEIFLLNLINYDSTSQKFSQNLEEVESKFKNLISAHPETAISLHPKIRSGKFLPSVLNFIEDEKIDLVVMGTHGSRGWDSFFMGSHIEKIVRTSPVPVFAVRGYANPGSIHDIVFPCNLKLDQHEIILKVKELQRLFHARLHLLRINTGKPKNNVKILDRLKGYARHYQLSNYTVDVLTNANVKDGILHYASETNADMIAMITTGKRHLRNLFAESTTADVVNHANILVWTCTG